MAFIKNVVPKYLLIQCVNLNMHLHNFLCTGDNINNLKLVWTEWLKAANINVAGLNFYNDSQNFISLGNKIVKSLNQCS